MTSLFQILMLLLNIVWFIVIAHVVMSWLINFQVLNLRQPLVAQIWDGLNRLLEPVYSRVRQIVPPMGGIDLAPLIVLIAVAVVRIVLMNNAAAFYSAGRAQRYLKKGEAGEAFRPSGLVHLLLVWESAQKSRSSHRFSHDWRCHAVERCLWLRRLPSWSAGDCGGGDGG